MRRAGAYVKTFQNTSQKFFHPVDNSVWWRVGNVHYSIRGSGVVGVSRDPVVCQLLNRVDIDLVLEYTTGRFGSIKNEFY